MAKPTSSKKRFSDPKKSKKKMSDFDMFILMAVLGIVLLITLILNKTFHFSIPIFGEELDFFGVNWTIYVKRNRFWFIISGLMTFFGIAGSIAAIITEKNKARQRKN